METELKLSIDSDDVAALRRHPLLRRYASAAPLRQRLVSVYFDTPELTFKRRAGALRVRRVARRWVQTLKGGGTAQAGLHRRDEWESAIAGRQPELAALLQLVGPDSEWAPILSDPALAQRLRPMFSCHVTRTTWQLRLEQGDEVELALDQGELRHAGMRLPICEIELELKSGQTSSLFDFALALQQDLPLRAGSLSKAERGYALSAPQPLAAVPATPLKLAPGLSVEQGWQAIAGDCMQQIQANEAGVMQGSDPECVHQMRVGLRRLRCALELFEPLRPCAPALQAEIEWLATALGSARDWEVLAAETLAKVIGAASGAPDLEPLRRAAQQVARARRRQAAAAIDSIRYARLWLMLGGWLQGAGWCVAPTPGQAAALAAPLARYGRQVLARSQKRLRRRGKRVRKADPRQCHRLRIAAKKARYATEFFQSLCHPRRVRPYLAALSALQEELGWINDMTVADGLLRQLATRRPELAHGAGFARGYLAGSRPNGLRRLGKLWRQFLLVAPPASH